MNFLKFLTKLKGFWKIFNGYGYDGETVEFIINNYTQVLESRTKIMSKPTYYARDVIEQIDEWYYEKQAAENKPNVCKIKRNVQMVRAKFEVTPEMPSIPSEYIKHEIILHLSDYLAPFVIYDIEDSPMGGKIYAGKLYVVTGEK